MASVELPKEDRTLDCSGDLCPMPVQKTHRAFVLMAPGEVLRIICTDPASVYDIPAFARRWRHELIAEDHHTEGRHVYLVRKAG